jgi:hypothetical protein
LPLLTHGQQEGSYLEVRSGRSEGDKTVIRQKGITDSWKLAIIFYKIAVRSFLRILAAKG